MARATNEAEINSLNRVIDKLTKNLDLNEVLDSLLAKELISEELYSEINQMLQNGKRVEANRNVIDKIKLNPSGFLETFIAILRENERTKYLGDVVDEEYQKQLKQLQPTATDSGVPKVVKEDHMQNKPKMKQLNRLAVPEIADIWERVAIQLNIKPQEVERIKRSQQVTSVKDNIIEMLRVWLNKNTASDSAKADELIEAVRTIGKNADAKEFETDRKNDENIVDPTYYEVKIATKLAPNWRDLGIELDFEPYELDTIARTDHYANGRCKEMFNIWLQSDEATWDKLYTAMCTVEKNSAAERVKKSVMEL